MVARGKSGIGDVLRFLHEVVLAAELASPDVVEIQRVIAV